MKREIGQRITHELRARWMRGGTSKGLFLHSRDLDSVVADASVVADPDNNASGTDRNIIPKRDELLCRALGSPDVFGKQIDGLGGATSSTSKVALIGIPSNRLKDNHHDIDVTYEFGQIPISSGRGGVDWTGSCGNLAAAVGVFALEEGLVQAPLQISEASSSIEIVVWQVNRSQKIRLQIPFDPTTGMPLVHGDENVAGIPFPGSPIMVSFEKPGYGEFSYCLPTGRVHDDLLENGLQVSIVDAGNPTIFVRAADLRLEGIELDLTFDTLTRIESIRCEAAVLAGYDLGRGMEYVHNHMPAVPKVSWIAPPRTYRTSSEQIVAETDIDLLARIVSVGKLHHAYTGTGAISLATAAAIPGTVVNETLTSLTCKQRKPKSDEIPSKDSGPLQQTADIRIGHTAGVLRTQASVVEQTEYNSSSLPDSSRWIVQSGGFVRTARTLMSGTVHIPG